METKHDTTAISETFERDGFVVFENFVSEEHLKALNHEIEEHFRPLLAQAASSAASARENMKQFECDVISWSPFADGAKAFLALRDDERLKFFTQACLGEGYSEIDSFVMWSVAGGKGQGWHQDCPSQDKHAFNMNRLFYVADVNEEDGAIVVVPGSHKRDRIPSGGNQEPIEGEVVLTPRAGTLVLLNGQVYHRVTANLSGKPRVSVNLRAFPHGISPDVCNIGVYRNGAMNFATGELVKEAVAS